MFQCDRLGINIVFAWIPGHSGILGNESVDSCARSAVQTGTLEHYQIYSHDICTILKPILFNSWTKQWQVSKTLNGKYYGDIRPEIPLNTWLSQFQKAVKATTSTVYCLRLNHSCTPIFWAKLRIRDGSICECGLYLG